VQSVKEFIKLLKWAIFKFYKIYRYMRSQEDSLNSLVTEIVLDAQVSAVLFMAAEKQLGDDLTTYSHALEFLFR
jgi:hypothetical protein